MSQSEIIVTASPKGVFLEGIISGTPKPGTCVTLTNTAEVGGRFTYEPYNADADGNRRTVLVLIEDYLQGKTKEDAYANGDRCFLYAPCMGEELKMLLADVSGTGDTHAIGELLIVDDSTGKLIATTGSPESEPFQLLEALAAPTADTHALCMYTGH